MKKCLKFLLLNIEEGNFELERFEKMTSKSHKRQRNAENRNFEFNEWKDIPKNLKEK